MEVVAIAAAARVIVISDTSGPLSGSIAVPEKVAMRLATRLQNSLLCGAVNTGLTEEHNGGYRINDTVQTHKSGLMINASTAMPGHSLPPSDLMIKAKIKEKCDGDCQSPGHQFQFLEGWRVPSALNKT